MAHADDEPGSAVVEKYLDAVTLEEANGYVNRVNLTEMRYILARKYSRMVADEYIDWLLDLGMDPVDVEGAWVEAAEYVISYNPALGDAFALATAERADAQLLVGADDEYDEITDVSIERFRTEAA